MIPYSRHSIDEADIKSVVEVLTSDWITQGPKIDEFEAALANYCGAKHAVAVNSGTSALHLACLSAGIGRSDEVVTSPITFVASANCSLYCGGMPVFADIDPETININLSQLKKKITERTKALIPVHFAGLPCDMERIHLLAKDRSLVIIEDACHALGAEYRESSGKWIRVGSCAHSDMAVMSFHPVKHITTGEGGAILTNDAGLYEKLMTLRTHGVVKKASGFKNRDMAFDEDGEPNPWYYEMHALGFNYRITDIQCALGASQLERIRRFVERRREIAGIYNRAFKNVRRIKTPREPKGRRSAYHLYVIRVDFKRLGKSRARVMGELKERGIGTQVHYIPVHLQPFYRKRYGYGQGAFPLAEAYYEEALSLPMYPRMTDEEANRVVEAVRGALNV